MSVEADARRTSRIRFAAVLSWFNSLRLNPLLPPLPLHPFGSTSRFSTSGLPSLLFPLCISSPHARYSHASTTNKRHIHASSNASLLTFIPSTILFLRSSSPFASLSSLMDIHFFQFHLITRPGRHSSHIISACIHYLALVTTSMLQSSTSPKFVILFPISS